MTATLVPGDDTSFPVELEKDHAAFLINGSATILAAVTTKNKNKVLIPATAVVEAAPGSDWANSLVVVEFTEAQTELVTHFGSALLEIQVDDGGKTTWFAPITIIKGTIV